MDLSNFFVSEEEDISEILKKMDSIGYGILLVGDRMHVWAVITDGDIFNFLKYFVSSNTLHI